MGYAILFAIIMITILGFSYYMNSKTPVPEGCENLNAQCNGCSIVSCGMNPNLKGGENVN